MTIDKKDVLYILERIAIYLELKGENPFKISAYRKAAQALERDERSMSEIDDVTKIKGIGAGTGAVIQSFLEQGKSDTLQQLEEEVPSGLIPLLDLPGLGGKKLAKLYQELQITDAESLQAACENGEVEKISGFGKKTVENILQALEDANKRPERLPLATMLPIVEKIETFLQGITAIEIFSRAGSLRRMRETIRDLDFIIATKQATDVRGELLEMDAIKETLASGETKVSVTISDVYDINVDFRIVKPEEFASTLHHFTGSKEHNVAMRQLAKEQDEKISEYGIENEKTGKIMTYSDETSFFHHFGLPFIPPEIRENTGEIETFGANTDLVNLKDIRGDLHMHTTWSDGAQSVEEMVNEAREKGYEFIAITDHSKFLRVADGLNESRLRRQREEIDRLNAKYTDIHVFAGVEMDILPDVSLDFEEPFLKEMDFVIAAIHSSFRQPQNTIMQRLNAALESPYVSLIAHPTGRLIGNREGYDVDVDKLIERAAATGTALEINANPKRLDLSAEWVRKAQAAGVMIAINTDAHNFGMLEHMEYGVGTARRGWLQKDTIINTWEKQRLIEFIGRKR